MIHDHCTYVPSVAMISCGKFSLGAQFMNNVSVARESSGFIVFTVVLSFPHNLPCTVQVFTEETRPVSAKGMRQTAYHIAGKFGEFTVLGVW